MRPLTARSAFVALLGVASALFLLALPGQAAGPAEGQPAPGFTLQDSQGSVYDLTRVDAPLLILYFCDLDSKPNREGLSRLNRLAGAYKGGGLQIWAVTPASLERARDTQAALRLEYPVLLDTKGVSERYNARVILPMIYVIGSGGTIVSVLSGAGRSTEEQLRKQVEIRLAPPAGRVEPTFQELKDKGIRAYDEQRLETASQYLAQTLAMKPDPESYLYLAHTWIELKQYEKVEETLDAAIASFPKEPRLYETTVDYLLARGDPRRAQSVLERGLEQLPDDPALLALRERVQRDLRAGTAGAQTRALPAPPIKKTVETAEQRARSLFNLARTENPKLTWDSCLAQKALQRAQRMARLGTFEHKDPGTGKNPAWDLVKACHKAAFAGENLSKGDGQSSRAIHAAFMESSSHRKNILDKRYTLMGVGCHESICVELFAGF